MLYASAGGNDWMALAEIDRKDATFVAASRTGWPKTLRGLKTAIEALENEANSYRGDGSQKNALHALTTLCDQWEADQ